MRPRRLIVLAGSLLVGAALVTGPLLSTIERVDFIAGWMMAFSVVSTIGFGDGPATGGGLLVAALLFAIAAVAYFLLITAAFGVAMQRIENDRLRRLRMQWTEKDALRLLDELSRN